MGKKFWAFVNWGILAVVAVIAIWIVLGFPSFGGGDGEAGSNIPSSISSDCVDVKSLDEFNYEACYDADSEMIFLKVSRGKSDFKVNTLEVSFVDFASQSYELSNVPGAGDDVAYKLFAKKNPKNIRIKLNVIKDFVGFVCEDKSVFVDYCPTGTSGSGVDVSISPIDGVGIKDFIEVEDMPDSSFGAGSSSDVVSMDLVEKEAIWESTCKSNWECGEWGACEDGFQYRNCKDSNNCIVSTNTPSRVQSCDGSCIENWECEWSACQNGFSIPVCRDLNDCGTRYNIPDKLSCEDSGACVPDVVCGDWSECEIDYNFVDLVNVNDLVDLTGVKFRVCVDDEGCLSAQREEKECSIGVDIYTKRFERCGEEYVGVYNVLNDEELAVLKEGAGDKPYLNIYFGEKDSVYCDYCYDGEMNADEESVDCGGSCKPCEDAVVEEFSWWDFLF